jgi:hypothetical protein
MMKIFVFLLLSGMAFAQCPQGTAYADGCSASPSGTAQYPTAFSSLSLSKRPEWNVAGVDYHVGIPSGTTLTAWSSYSASNLSVNTGNGRFDCTSPGATVTVTAVDFTTGGGGYIYDANSCNWVISNSKFGCPPAFANVINGSSVSITNSEFDHTGCISSTGPSSFISQFGTNALKYNWIKKGNQHILEGACDGAGGCQFNLIDDMLPSGCTFGQHENWQQPWFASGSSTISNAEVGYNFAYHHTSGTGCGEGWQWYSDNAGGTWQSPKLHHNTVVTLAGTGMSNVVNAGGPIASKPQPTFVNAENKNNYFYLLSGSPYYLGTVTSARGWTSECNTDMGNGNLINPADNSESALPGNCPTGGTGSSIPSVTTTAASSITTTTASSGGNVTADGGDSVTARGVCRSTSVNPTTSDTCTSNGTGTGAFTSSLTGMTANTFYHIRAFATNSVGTAYGSDLTFTTSGAPAPQRIFVILGKAAVEGSAVIQ